MDGIALLCVVAGFGVRESIKAIRGKPVSPTKSATVAFWLGIAIFIGAIGIMALVVMAAKSSRI
jgi:hypothetical protein